MCAWVCVVSGGCACERVLSIKCVSAISSKIQDWKKFKVMVKPIDILNTILPIEFMYWIFSIKAHRVQFFAFNDVVWQNENEFRTQIDPIRLYIHIHTVETDFSSFSHRHLKMFECLIFSNIFEFLMNFAYPTTEYY